MRQGQDNRKKALLVTVLLHALLVAVVILGIEFSDYRPLSGPKVEIVEAELVTTPSKPRVDPEAERRKREEAERQRQAQAEAERQREIKERERRQHAKEQRKQTEALAQQKAEAEARQKAEAQAEDRRKAEQEAKKKAELEAERKAALAAKKKAEEEARRKQAEEEARRRAEAEQQAREQALSDALAQEERERELNPLRDAYSNAISQKISHNWLKPQGISDDLKCEARVTQTPDGNVTSAKITRSSGNAVFDESVIKAIYKAAPLPQPPSPEVFDRDLEIGFCSTGNVC